MRFLLLVFLISFASAAHEKSSSLALKSSSLISSTSTITSTITSVSLAKFAPVIPGCGSNVEWRLCGISNKNDIVVKCVRGVLIKSACDYGLKCKIINGVIGCFAPPLTTTTSTTSTTTTTTTSATSAVLGFAKFAPVIPGCGSNVEWRLCGVSNKNDIVVKCVRGALIKTPCDYGLKCKIINGVIGCFAPSLTTTTSTTTTITTSTTTSSTTSIIVVNTTASTSLSSAKTSSVAPIALAKYIPAIPGCGSNVEWRICGASNKNDIVVKCIRGDLIKTPCDYGLKCKIINGVIGCFV